MKLLALWIALFSGGCKGKGITVNINSKYKGDIYLLSANVNLSKDIIEVDTNEIAYVPEYCRDGIAVNITVDHIKIEREPFYVEDNGIYGSDFEVSYKTFCFPFYPRKIWCGKCKNGNIGGARKNWQNETCLMRNDKRRTITRVSYVYRF